MVVPKRKTPAISDLDPNMVSLVEAVNSFKEIKTVGNCGGHADHGPAQNPLGEWRIAFRLAADEHGSRAREFLAWLVNNDARRSGSKVQLEPAEQDAIAALILEELADDRRWDESFANSQDQLSKLAAKVRQDITDGRARDGGIDEL